MSTSGSPRSAAQPPGVWSPTWAKILAWVVLVPSFMGMVLGAIYFIMGFGAEGLAGIGLIVGPILFLLALAVVVPGVLFLVLKGKTAFVAAMVTAGLYLLIVAYFGLV